MDQVSLRARVLFPHEPGAPRKILAVACSPNQWVAKKPGNLVAWDVWVLLSRY
jgi:hypothetical protein